jgi:bifunctional DNA-binding transcriptional regulator/antitoxin component of YhaV-PrlF toxin-antitoxin module
VANYSICSSNALFNPSPPNIPILLTITILCGFLNAMKTITSIDSAGRVVIPRELRKKNGFESGKRIQIIPGEESVTLVPERNKRRFIKCGPILTIYTGVEAAPMEAFDVLEMRKDH